MLTKHIYILGICAAALIGMLIIAATMEQSELAPVKTVDTQITLPAAGQPTIDSSTLLAIEDALHSIQDAVPALKSVVAQNQQANDKRIKAIEENIRQLKLAVQHSEDTTEQAAATEPQVFSPEQEQALAQERALAQVAAFDQALDEEVRDEGWAAEMESMISYASQGELYQGSKIGSPSCKSSFCRFEAFHDGMDSQDNFELIRRELPNSYHMQHFDTGGGSSRTVMYVIRQGEEMKNIIFNTLNPGAR
ncbi:hypothetical protein SG34_007475 [Thalassomonas viridans]|uniref:Uncharacterized protein n=1 Tax=Thalassomonas viridans TaxID=137584 RepID=A0AAF0CAV8_9GAMM|nr:hypothetical protein [Thalassomonas viridans]WDE06735.1 hypothetical protein SG34_007475 [Thalassomonas viridans]